MSFNGAKNTAYGVYGIESNGFANPTHLAPGTNTSTTLGYLANVTSDIQTQLNNLAPIASPTFTGTVTAPVLDLTNNTNQLVFGTTNTLTFTMAALTASRTCTFPDANSNPVQPSSGSTNQFVNAISSAGVVSYGYPGILNDVQKSNTNTSMTTATDIIVAVAPLQNANGYYILTITDGTNALTIHYELQLEIYNIGLRPPFLVTQVYDTNGIITKDNLSNYLTFIAYNRSTNPNTYIAVTARMTGGLLYGGTTYKFICTCFTESFLSDNTAITQYLAQPFTNLPAADNSYILNGNTVQYSYFPPSNLFVYATGTNRVQPYTINSSTGILTAGTFASATGAFDVVAIPNGEVIFVSNTGGGATIYGYNVNIATGGLTLGTTNSTGGLSITFMVIHPNGKFLYLTSLSNIFMFSISGTTLTPLSPPSLAQPNQSALTISPNGQYLYIAGGGNNNIRQYSINTSTGALTALSPATVSSTSCWAVAVHPNGNFAYATNNTSGAGTNLNLFSIDSGGHLAPLSPATASVGSLPKGVVISPNGQYLYVVNNGDNTISCFSINTSTGALTALSPATVATGSLPNYAKITANGNYLYVTNQSGATVQAYSIASNGNLTSLGTISAPSNTENLFIV